MRYLYLLIFLCIRMLAMAQQEPVFSHYMFNSLSFNPAYAGNKDMLSLQTAYRIQWLGIEGAPRTLLLNADMPIKNNKMALGIDAYQDRVGDFSVTKFYTSYAYKIQLNSTLRASFGLAGGLENWNLNRNNISSAGNIDPLLNANNFNKTTFDFRTGTYISNDDFYIGISATSLLENLYNTNGSNAIQRNYYLTAGYLYKLSPTLVLYPSFLYRDDFSQGGTFNFTQLVGINSNIWAGLSYRNGTRFLNDAKLATNNSSSRVMSLLFDLELNDQFRVGYSYDYSLSILNQFENGSHEINVAYYLSSKKSSRMLNPRYL